MKNYSIVLVMLLSGCSALVPSERSRIQSVAQAGAVATETERTTQRTFSAVPEAARAIAQDSAIKGSPVPYAIREQVTETHHTSTGGTGSDSATGSSALTIPAGVKFALLGIGIAVLVGSLIWAWRSVKATSFGQAISLADEAFARQIQALRRKAQTSINPSEVAEAASQISDLESERGKLARKK